MEAQTLSDAPEPATPVDLPLAQADAPAPLRATRAMAPVAVRQVNWLRDTDDYSRWTVAHGLPSPDLMSLPVLGAIAEGKAAALLYRTDSDIAFIDGLVISPECPWRERVQAVEAVLQFLLDLARLHGFKKVVAYPGLPSVQRIALRLGCRCGPLGVMVAKEV